MKKSSEKIKFCFAFISSFEKQLKIWISKFLEENSIMHFNSGALNVLIRQVAFVHIPF